MNKLPTLVLLASCASFAHADWVKIDSRPDELALYADTAAAEKSGASTIKLWHVVDYAKAQQYDGKAFRSIKANYEYDCDKRAFRKLIRILHKDPMGNGLTVYWTHGLWSWTHDPSTWSRAEEGSLEATLVSTACRKL